MKQTFIEVIAKFDTGGRVIPQSIFWGDRQYTVDRIVDIRRRAAQKTGGIGLCYTCYILGKERQLFYDESKWFVQEV